MIYVGFMTTISFNKHYVYIQNKASSMLRFIMRSCKDFDNPLTLKSLYCAFVRPVFDYNSVVWSPYTNSPIKSIESIQNRFLRILCHKCNILRPIYSSYQPILLQFKFDSLKDRKIKFDINFIFKLINCFIDCPILLPKLMFLVPSHTTRQTDTFYTPSQRTIHNNNSPLIRCMQLVNTHNVDIFVCNSIISFNVVYLNNLLL